MHEAQGYRLVSRHPIILPSLSLLLALAGNDLDPLRLNSVGIIKLELNILDNERPDFVAKAVGVEVSL
jgi:hypothetical protein